MMVVHGALQRTPIARRRQTPQLVITDVDNTLYDFGAYFEAGLEGLVAAVSEALHMPQPQVLSALKGIFARHGTIEYPFALEEFSEVVALSPELRREVLRKTAKAFWSAAGKALRPYPGVLEALRDLRREGVDVVAFTDAPIHEAIRRLRGLGVDHLLSGVVATEWFGPRGRKTAVLRVDDVPGFLRVPRRLSLVGRLSNEERKPNPLTFERIMNAFEMTPEQVTVIGDSPARDLAPAAALGMRAVWARYGRRDPSREVMLQQVVPFRLPEIRTLQDTAGAAFMAVDRFDQLLSVLPTQQVLPLGFG